MLLWDGYGLQSTHSGIGRHALELALELEKLGLPPTIIPSVDALDPVFSSWTAQLSNFPLSKVKPLSLLAAGFQAKALAKLAKDPRPIFHGLSNYNLPALPKTFRKVLTVHDLIPFIFPEGVSKNLHRYLSYQMPKALARADVIICVSQWTACSVKNQFPEVKDKVVVIPNGKSLLVRRAPREERETVRILSLSRSETYKRLHLIPEIAARLPQNFEWHVVTDGKGRSFLEDKERIFVHQSVRDESLSELWQKTDIFVHPSLWEGYCLPAGAALSHGIPSVYTGGSGIDEVVGEGGLRLSATASSEEWADAIETIAKAEEGFKTKAERQYASLPAWSEVAGQLKRIYDSIS